MIKKILLTAFVLLACTDVNNICRYPYKVLCLRM